MHRGLRLRSALHRHSNRTGTSSASTETVSNLHRHTRNVRFLYKRRTDFKMIWSLVSPIAIRFLQFMSRERGQLERADALILEIDDEMFELLVTTR
jgi:hypothetical protein